MDVRSYLDRLGIEGPVPGPNLDALTALTHAHVHTLPFENFDIHLGIPIALDYSNIYDKIVHRRRGGFCYELNGLFGHLLSSLGYDVAYLSARVARGRSFDPEFGHMALRVVIDGDKYLVDVGYGDSIRAPMPLEAGQEQRAGDRTYRLERRGDSYVLSIYGRKGYRGGYEFDDLPRRLSDFAPMCRYHQTSPLSWFTQRRVCTLPIPRGRVTLSEYSLIRTLDGLRLETRIGSAQDYRWTLLNNFNVELPRVPDNRGERLVARLHRNTLVWQRRVNKAWGLLRGPPQFPSM